MTDRTALRQAWDEECGHLGRRLAALEHLQSSRRDESRDWTELTATRVLRIERGIAELKLLLAEFGVDRTAATAAAGAARPERRYPIVGIGKLVWTAPTRAGTGGERSKRP